MHDYGMSEELKQKLTDFFALIDNKDGFKNSELATINLMEYEILRCKRTTYDLRLSMARVIESDMDEHQKDLLITRAIMQIDQIEEYQSQIEDVEKDFEDYIHANKPSLNERIVQFFNGLKKSRHKDNIETEEVPKK